MESEDEGGEQHEYIEGDEDDEKEVGLLSNLYRISSSLDFIFFGI